MEILLKTNIYPLEAVINTCYNYLDRAYIYLDGDVEKAITVFLKIKKRGSKAKLEKLKSEFLNDLIYSTLRYRINLSNKKITEYVIKHALYSALPKENEEFSDKGGLVDSKEWLADPLGIAIPWEEKYGKKQKKIKSKNRKNKI